MSICPKNKSSKARRDKRRANWKMSAPNLVKCSKCGELMMPHRVCKACGSYNKKEIILAALEKNADVNIEELVKKTSAPDKLLKEKLLKKLQWGLMTIVLSIGLFIYAIFVGDAGELKLYVICSVALLAIGVSLLFTYLMGKKMLAKEMEAEEQNLRQS